VSGAVATGEGSSLDDGRVVFGEPVDKHVSDPVCGKRVDPNDVQTFSTTYEGTTYYFCSSACERRFLEEPETYATP